MKLIHKKWFHTLSVSYNHVSSKPNKTHVSTSHKNSFKDNLLSVLLSRFVRIISAYGRSSLSKVLLRKDVLKICSKLKGEHTCRGVISIKLQSNFFEIILRHGCSPVNLLHISKTHSPKNTYDWVLLIW